MSNKRFEFSYMHLGQPHFAVVYDDNILRACERILFRAIAPEDLVQTTNGTWFVRSWFDNEFMAVKEDVWMPSSVGSTPTVDPSEKKTTRSKVPTQEEILQGLIDVQFH